MERENPESKKRSGKVPLKVVVIIWTPLTMSYAKKNPTKKRGITPLDSPTSIVH